MRKKLFYTVGYEVESEIKTINIYNIVDNEPEKFGYCETDYESSSVEAIERYLSDNGHGDETFILIEL